MHLRNTTYRGVGNWFFRCTAVFAFVAALSSVAAAQLTSAADSTISVPAPAVDAASFPTASVSSVLAEGTRLESLRRWGDALSHYEDALRKFPGDQDLARREDVAKLHWSLERRYADQSYIQSLRTLSAEQASGLYLELLRKVNAHYVTAPPWRKLAQRGAAAIDLALSDNAFRTTNSIGLSDDQLAPVRRQVYDLVGRLRLEGPEDLSACAADVARIVESQAGLRQTASILEFVTAAAGGLDEYSAYLTSDQLRDVYSQIEGNFVGLGVELKADRGALLIVHVIPGSPAERAGILDNDRIIAVDGRATGAMTTDEAASLLTGAEGSYVQVTAATPGQEPRVLTVRREHVEVPSLEGVKIINAEYGVAYIRIPAFQKTTSRDLEAALWNLHSQKMRTLVLDLRGNPGGLLTAAVEVADKFLQEGGIVSTRGRSPQEDFNYQAHYGGTWRVPLVVLIDGDSASASEIFAGAIKDNNRGIIVGERSYGKGSVQGIFPLGYAGAGVRLTTALFYSPLGTKISHVGVSPNREVHSVAKPTAPGVSQLTVVDKDLVLEAGVAAAIETAKSRVASR